VVVLIVMGAAVVLFGVVVLVAGRGSTAATAVEAVGLDIGPASAAMLLAAGVAMLALGAYPLVVPWGRDGGPAAVSTPGDRPAGPIAELNVTGRSFVPTAPPAGG
jgi:hypothetical protein